MTWWREVIITNIRIIPFVCFTCTATNCFTKSKIIQYIITCIYSVVNIPLSIFTQKYLQWWSWLRKKNEGNKIRREGRWFQMFLHNLECANLGYIIPAQNNWLQLRIIKTQSHIYIANPTLDRQKSFFHSSLPVSRRTSVGVLYKIKFNPFFENTHTQMKYSIPKKNYTLTLPERSNTVVVKWLTKSSLSLQLFSSI